MRWRARDDVVKQVEADMKATEMEKTARAVRAVACVGLGARTHRVIALTVSNTDEMATPTVLLFPRDKTHVVYSVNPHVSL